MHESVPASDSEIAALREENTIRTRTGFARLLPLMALTGLAAGAIALLANAPHRRLPLVPVIREPLDRASAAHFDGEGNPHMRLGPGLRKRREAGQMPRFGSEGT